MSAATPPPGPCLYYVFRALVDGGTEGGVVDAETFIAAHQRALSELAGDEVADLFITMNPIALGNVELRRLGEFAPSQKGRPNGLRPVGAGYQPEDGHIARIRWVMADFDPVRMGEDGEKLKGTHSATDGERVAAILVRHQVVAELAALGIDRNHLWIEDTPNGGRVLLPVDLENDADGSAAVRDFVMALRGRFSTQRVEIDPTVVNPARFTRVVGSVGRKGEATDTRPHRASALVGAAPGEDVPRLDQKQLQNLTDRIRGAGEKDLKLRKTEERKAGRAAKEVAKSLQAIEAALRARGLGSERAQSEKRVIVFRLAGVPCPHRATHGTEDTPDAWYLGVLEETGAIIAECHHRQCPMAKTDRKAERIVSLDRVRVLLGVADERGAMLSQPFTDAEVAVIRALHGFDRVEGVLPLDRLRKPAGFTIDSGGRIYGFDGERESLGLLGPALPVATLDAHQAADREVIIAAYLPRHREWRLTAIRGSQMLNTRTYHEFYDRLPIEVGGQNIAARFFNAYLAENGPEVPCWPRAPGVGWAKLEGERVFGLGSMVITRDGPIRPVSRRDLLAGRAQVEGVGRIVVTDGGSEDPYFSALGATRGTWEGWCELAMLVHDRAPAVELALYASLAAPLLPLVANARGFGLEYVAKPQSGKTTACVYAASAWGSPGERDGLMGTWGSASDVGIELAAVRARNVPLILDDTDRVGEKDFVAVGKLAYAVAAGWGSTRGRIESDGTLTSERSRIETILLSSGTRGLDFFVRHAGAMSRVLTLRPPFCPDAEFAIYLRRTAAAHHGHAAHRFLAALYDESIDEVIEKAVNSALDRYGVQRDRQLDTLCLIAAAAAVAARAGIPGAEEPWRALDVLQCAVEGSRRQEDVFRGALDDLFAAIDAMSGHGGVSNLNLQTGGGVKRDQLVVVVAKDHPIIWVSRAWFEQWAQGRETRGTPSASKIRMPQKPVTVLSEWARLGWIAKDGTNLRAKHRPPTSSGLERTGCFELTEAALRLRIDEQGLPTWLRGSPLWPPTDEKKPRSVSTERGTPEQ